MPKIRIELKVPNDCRDCEHFDFYLEMCNLFDDLVPLKVGNTLKRWNKRYNKR